MRFSELRAQIRNGQFTRHTSGLFGDCAQYNVLIIPKCYADDFELFCQKNKIPCPLIMVSEAGQKILSRLGEVDICRDIPLYEIFKKGRLVQEVSDISAIWRDDLVTFVMGCSFTFEQSIQAAGIPLLHVEAGKNIAMYQSNIQLNTVGVFSGDMIVSMRWVKPSDLSLVVKITEQYPDFHGGPVHIGNPAKIGIKAIEQPDFGDYIPPVNDMVPVFWGCGVTPQAVLANAKLSLAITHKPGCMLAGELTHHDVLNKNY